MLFHPFISMFIVTKVSFLLLCKNKCGCFNRVWRDSVLEAEQTGNMKTKAQSAHLACVSLSGCWLGSGNMAQCTFTFLGGRAKCAGRELESHVLFLRCHASAFCFCQICFKNALKLVLISMFSFSSLKAGLVHFYNKFYDAYYKWQQEKGLCLKK